MQRTLLIGSDCVALTLAGWYYSSHSSKVPPAPKDLTTILPKQLLQKASSPQLAVFRGQAASALLVAGTPGGGAARPAAIANTTAATPG